MTHRHAPIRIVASVPLKWLRQRVFAGQQETQRGGSECRRSYRDSRLRGCAIDPPMSRRQLHSRPAE